VHAVTANYAHAQQLAATPPEGQQLDLVVHLAEWVVPAPLRVRALSTPNLQLTDDLQLASLFGCMEQRSVMDGIAW
jgi:hypothetical protein